MGRSDSKATIDEVLAHLNAVEVPVNADFEGGYAVEPELAVARIRAASVDQVGAIVAAVAPKPVNLLINAPFMTVAEAACLGVRRISVGGTLTRFEHLPHVDGRLGG